MFWPLPVMGYGRQPLEPEAKARNPNRVMHSRSPASGGASSERMCG